ncbi:hypothetical protein Q1695_000566 [Nippostrongylus brasiliensis]|nr:hypothetical protein Q1695_000566 [Nippostrongylus brasiliensis]
MFDDAHHSPIAPHRGFNNKAREVLIGGDDIHLGGMTSKSSSEFDIRRKIIIPKNQQSPGTPSSPKTPNSSCSYREKPVFDSIGEPPAVKRHKQLSQIGKTKSCGEIKHFERRLIKTFQEENIIKMPSIDSELANIDLNSDRLFADLDVIGKSRAYEVSDEQKKKNVTSWLTKQSSR